MMDSMPEMPKRATVTQASNGYIVSCLDKKGNEKKVVCKNMNEVHEAINGMMDKETKKEDKTENYNDVKMKANEKMMKK